MDNPAPDQPGSNQLAPETLHERSSTGPSGAASETSVPLASEAGKKQRRSYRPGRRATFIGLAVVLAILAVNGVVIALVLRAQTPASTTLSNDQVSVSQDVLNKIGVNRGTVGDSGVTLTIGPNAEFKNKVTVGGSLQISGQFNLNGKLVVADASLTQLQAGKTALNSLTVSSDTTVNTLSVQQQLAVIGPTVLQGPLTAAQLVTINNSANIAGNVSVGGTVAAALVTSRSLTTTSTLTINGHVLTAGSIPFMTRGTAGLGPNGRLSVSGNDAAGTLFVTVDIGGMTTSGGIIANLTFRNPYAATPHVVVTPIGDIKANFYITRSSTGFSIGVSDRIPNPGAYAFDYIVEQ